MTARCWSPIRAARSRRSLAVPLRARVTRSLTVNRFAVHGCFCLRAELAVRRERNTIRNHLIILPPVTHLLAGSLRVTRFRISFSRIFLFTYAFSLVASTASVLYGSPRSWSSFLSFCSPETIEMTLPYFASPSLFILLLLVSSPFSFHPASPSFYFTLLLLLLLLLLLRLLLLLLLLLLLPLLPPPPSSSPSPSISSPTSKFLLSRLLGPCVLFLSSSAFHGFSWLASRARHPFVPPRAGLLVDAHEILPNHSTLSQILRYFAGRGITAPLSVSAEIWIAI